MKDQVSVCLKLQFKAWSYNTMTINIQYESYLVVCCVYLHLSGQQGSERAICTLLPGHLDMEETYLEKIK